MRQQEADKIVMEMGCHPYSRLAMIDALLEGEKIGKREQQAIDEDHLREVKKMLIDKACEWLKRQLYTGDTGWLASEKYQELGEFIQVFRKAMEE